MLATLLPTRSVKDLICPCCGQICELVFGQWQPHPPLDVVAFHVASAHEDTVGQCGGGCGRRVAHEDEACYREFGMCRACAVNAFGAEAATFDAPPPTPSRAASEKAALAALAHARGRLPSN